MPDRTETLLEFEIRDREVGDAVAVQVADRHRAGDSYRRRSCWQHRRSRSRCRGRTETLLESRVGDREVGEVVAVEVADCDRLGRCPALKVLAAPKDPAPVPSRTETLLDPQFATARSRKLSPLRLPIATEAGSAPTTGKLLATPKEPVPVPSRTETLFELRLATARSGKLSPLRLPIVTAAGLPPAAKLVAAPKEPVPFRAGPRRCHEVGDREVGEGVAVEVADRHRPGRGAGIEACCRTEGAGPGSEQNRDVVGDGSSLPRDRENCRH